MSDAPGIVWLASFPKSGNTWFRIFLANLAAGRDEPADINDLDERGGIASSRHEFEAATLLDSGLISHADIDRLRPRIYERIAAETKAHRWIKVHAASTLVSRFPVAPSSALYCSPTLVFQRGARISSLPLIWATGSTPEGHWDGGKPFAPSGREAAPSRLAGSPKQPAP